MKILFVESPERLTYREMKDTPYREMPGHMVIPRYETTVWTPQTIPTIDARTITVDNYILQFYFISLGHEAYRWRTPMYLHESFRMDDLARFDLALQHQIIGYVMTWAHPTVLNFGIG